jgi:hypothetical protein
MKRDGGLASAMGALDVDRDPGPAAGTFLPVRGSAPLAGRTAFGRMIERPIGKEPLLSGSPDEVGAARDTLQVPILEIHLADPYSCSRRCFLRLRLRAKACFARRRSPGFM